MQDVQVRTEGKTLTEKARTTNATNAFTSGHALRSNERVAGRPSSRVHHLSLLLSIQAAACSFSTSAIISLGCAPEKPTGCPSPLAGWMTKKGTPLTPCRARQVRTPLTLLLRFRRPCRTQLPGRRLRGVAPPHQFPQSRDALATRNIHVPLLHAPHKHAQTSPARVSKLPQRQRFPQAPLRTAPRRDHVHAHALSGQSRLGREKVPRLAIGAARATGVVVAARAQQAPTQSLSHRPSTRRQNRCLQALPPPAAQAPAPAR